MVQGLIRVVREGATITKDETCRKSNGMNAQTRWKLSLRWLSDCNVWGTRTQFRRTIS